MSSVMNPDNILGAFAVLESELPLLTGKDWQAVEKKLRILKLQIRESKYHEQRDRLVSKIVDLILPYKLARNRFNEEICLQHIRSVLQDTLKNDLPEFAKTMGADKKTVKASADVALKLLATESKSSGAGVRLVKIKPGGVDGGKTIKTRNLHLDPAVLIDLGAGATMMVSKIVGQPHPIIILAGILLTIRALSKAITCSISEREASVFWGLIQAQRAGACVDKPAITKHTNNERTKYGLYQLSENQVTDALKKLRALKCVELSEQKPDTWLIVEDYEIKH
jgi:hypothetical protein